MLSKVRLLMAKYRLNADDAWKKVVYSADCDEDGNCPVCDIDYAQCDCIGPTMDENEVEYKWSDDVLYGRLR